MKNMCFAKPIGLIVFVAALFPISAQAHVGVQGPAFAGKSQVLTFSIGHGCAGADTYRLELEIPESVSSVRVLPSACGEAEVTRNADGAVTAVSWSKATVRNSDDSYYQFQLRIGVPNVPFTSVYFPAKQYCRSAEGEESVVEWIGTDGHHDHEGPELDGGAPEEAAEPAPALFVLPPRLPGCNKYVLTDHVHDMAVFDDALIVWSGNAAYSSNPTTKEQIVAEEDVTVLTEAHPGTEIWVKY